MRKLIHLVSVTLLLCVCFNSGFATEIHSMVDPAKQFSFDISPNWQLEDTNECFCNVEFEHIENKDVTFDIDLIGVLNQSISIPVLHTQIEDFLAGHAKTIPLLFPMGGGEEILSEGDEFEFQIQEITPMTMNNQEMLKVKIASNMIVYSNQNHRELIPMYAINYFFEMNYHFYVLTFMAPTELFPQYECQFDAILASIKPVIE